MKNINLINQKNHFGKTVLHYAIAIPSIVFHHNETTSSSMLSLIDLLIEFGVHVDSHDFKHKTPLYCAICEQVKTDQLKLVILKLIQFNCDQLNLFQCDQIMKQFDDNKMLSSKLRPTLKQLCRCQMIKHYDRLIQLDDSQLKQFLPQEIIYYLKRKLIMI